MAGEEQRVTSRFATRLAEALADRGLSFAAVRQELDAHGVSLSAASLSYWSTGRSVPTRHRSRGVVAALEQVLRVPEGWLLEALDPSPQADEGLIDRTGLLQRAIVEHRVRRDTGWRQLLVHQENWFGSDRAEKGYRVRDLTVAEVDGLQHWAVAVSEHTGPVECVETTGCELVRQVDVAPSLAILEFCTPRPLALGESAMTGHRISYPGNGDEATELGYGLARPTGHLVLQAHFAGQLPREVQLTYTPGQDVEPSPLDHPVLVGEHEVQACVERAAAGLYRLVWRW